MTVAASSRGRIMLRIDPAQGETLLADPRAELVVMQGREMPGWLSVQIDGSTTEEELGGWVEHGLAYVHSLPPK
jgi:hypothetical protein